jgi:RNA polymerase sigma factor (sigma-70 family)
MEADLRSIRSETDVLVRRPSTEGAEAFTGAFALHHPDVFRYALVLTGDRDDADDIAAETFLRAWRAWESRREPEGPMLPWLLVIARHLATDRWRRAARLAHRVLSPSPNLDVAQVDTMIWFGALLRLLPTHQREVVVLRYIRDLGDEDVARIMGLSQSGVRSLAARAIATLRAHPEAWR